MWYSESSREVMKVPHADVALALYGNIAIGGAQVGRGESNQRQNRESKQALTHGDIPQFLEVFTSARVRISTTVDMAGCRLPATSTPPGQPRLLAAAPVPIDVAKISALASAGTKRGTAARRPGISTGVLRIASIATCGAELWTELTLGSQQRQPLLHQMLPDRLSFCPTGCGYDQNKN
jgi:hypothetical protein